MKIFIKYTAFTVLCLGHALSTDASDKLENVDSAITEGVRADTQGLTPQPPLCTNIQATFAAEFNTQIQRAVVLFDKIYGRTIDTTPEYLLGVLDEACAFLGDGAPFRLDDDALLRRNQSFLRPLHSRSRQSITRPGDFNELSFLPRLIMPMEHFICTDPDFSEDAKILAATFFDKLDTRVFAFDTEAYRRAMQNPLVLKFFLLKTISKCIVDFHLIFKMMLIEQLRGIDIPLSVLHKNQVLASLTSFAVNAAESPNVLIDGKIASLVHKNKDLLGTDAFLETVRGDLLAYFSGGYLHYLSQLCQS